MGKDILLSFKDEFASLIYQGTKKWELRKSKINQLIKFKTKAFIYEVAPKKQVTGYFNIGKSIWTTYHHVNNLIDLDDQTINYLKTHGFNKRVFFIEIIGPIEFRIPIKTNDLLGFKIPQSFRYLTPSESKLLINNGM